MIPEIRTYIDSTQDDRRELFLELHELIIKLFPDVNIKISYKLPFYTTTKGWIFLGYWKQGVSIYPGIIPSLEEFRKNNPKIKMGKGSINLKLKDEIPWQAIENVIREAMTTRKGSMRS
ncbi:MAG TPA: DUF1801 domain-containing protein [Candidatus Cloacimonadota bacterium]|nr:DUF1801 domain-containing protein [Candidatus Cloacimonadota bacterium]